MKIVYKEVGETPLLALERLRREMPDLKDEKLSYAGRLDPMAEGLLLVLVGEENKERQRYLCLDKTYEAEILFGVSTDTYDVLGKIVNKSDKKPDEKEILEYLNKSQGKHEWSYPPFSSKTVHGVPLFTLARKGLISILPKREVTMYSFKIGSLREIEAGVLHEMIKNKISKIKGDFRQEDILKGWDEYFNLMKWTSFVLNLTLSVSSGFYIRTLANELGKNTMTGAVLLSLKRTKVGDFTK